METSGARSGQFAAHRSSMLYAVNRRVNHEIHEKFFLFSCASCVPWFTFCSRWRTNSGLCGPGHPVLYPLSACQLREPLFAHCHHKTRCRKTLVVAFV